MMDTARNTDYVNDLEQSARMLAIDRADFRRLSNKLLDALLIALPYVEDAEGFPEQFKTGVVKAHAKAVRAAIALAEENARL